MSQVNAFADPIIGPTLESKQDFVHGDSILAIYIIYEKNKLEDSFYYPYLKSLPEPESICSWNKNEIHQLQVNDIQLFFYYDKLTDLILFFFQDITMLTKLNYKNKLTQVGHNIIILFQHFIIII